MTTTLSNNIDLLTDQLLELVVTSIKPTLRELSEYVIQERFERLADDLESQSSAARLLGISQPRINQLIRSGKINVYTARRLVRVSEIKHYLANKTR